MVFLAAKMNEVQASSAQILHKSDPPQVSVQRVNLFLLSSTLVSHQHSHRIRKTSVNTFKDTLTLFNMHRAELKNLH